VDDRAPHALHFVAFDSCRRVRIDKEFRIWIRVKSALLERPGDNGRTSGVVRASDDG